MSKKVPSYFENVITSLKQGSLLLPRLASFLEKEALAQNEDREIRGELVRRDSVLTIKAMKHRYAEFAHGVTADPRTSKYFHPSSLGQCLRKMWFEKFKAPRDRRHRDDAFKSYLTFEFGTYLHIIFQNLCHRAGLLHKREFRLVNDEHQIIGTCDGILKIDGQFYILEIKSINSNQWGSVQQAPKFEHRQQLLSYMRALNLRWGIIVYVNKDRSICKEYVIAYEQAVYIEHVRDRIAGFRTHIKKRTLPAREGESADRMPCTFCPYPSTCFTPEKLKAFVYSLQNEGKN